MTFLTTCELRDVSSPDVLAVVFDDYHHVVFNDSVVDDDGNIVCVGSIKRDGIKSGLIAIFNSELVLLRSTIIDGKNDIDDLALNGIALLSGGRYACCGCGTTAVHGGVTTAAICILAANDLSTWSTFTHHTVNSSFSAVTGHCDGGVACCGNAETFGLVVTLDDQLCSRAWVVFNTSGVFDQFNDIDYDPLTKELVCVGVMSHDLSDVEKPASRRTIPIMVKFDDDLRVESYFKSGNYGVLTGCLCDDSAVAISGYSSISQNGSDCVMIKILPKQPTERTGASGVMTCEPTDGRINAFTSDSHGIYGCGAVYCENRTNGTFYHFSTDRKLLRALDFHSPYPTEFRSISGYHGSGAQPASGLTIYCVGNAIVDGVSKGLVVRYNERLPEILTVRTT